MYPPIQENKAQISGFKMEKMTKSVVSVTILNDGNSLELHLGIKETHKEIRISV